MSAKPEPIAVAVGEQATTALHYSAGANSFDAALILGHGAGAGQQSTFMVDFAVGLSAMGLQVVTFNFLYAEQRRKVPDRAPVLESTFESVIGVVRERLGSARRRLFIGGKSMGGRIATQIAASRPQLPIEGLVLLGYPLHPPGRPDQLRDKHLSAIGRPMLFVQGGRDTFGTPDELAPILKTLTPSPTLQAVDRGDHSFKIGKKDPAAQQVVYANIQRAIIDWITQAPSRRPRV